MEKIAQFISIILSYHRNEILVDKQIIMELQNIENIGVKDEMLIKRTLTMMVRKGMVILDRTETRSYEDDAGVRHWITRRFFRAKNSKPVVNTIQKPDDTAQKQLYSYFD